MIDFLDRFKETFVSGKNRWKTKCGRTFRDVLPVVQGMDSSELGFALDAAVDMRNNLVNGVKVPRNPSDPDKTKFIKIPLEVFIDPVLISDDIKCRCLDEIMDVMLSDPSGALAGSLTIWSISICAMTFPENRRDGKKIWKEFSRGFRYCKIFNPKKDIPIGLREFESK
tara:strand:- start:27 stop:533 length:507 start_codon:yes stop_codon:yes gene_type:complete